MNHESMKEMLFAFYDGELPAETRSLVETHLTFCAECRGVLEQWKQTRRAALAPLRVVDSTVFVQRVMRAVRVYGVSKESLRWSRFIRWAFPALALSVSSFAVSMFIVMQPAALSTDALLVGDSASVTAQWLANSPNEDQILDAVGVKP